MKLCLLFSFLIISNRCLAQTKVQIDSMVNAFCLDLANAKEQNDSIRFFTVLNKHSENENLKFTHPRSKEEKMEMAMTFIVRLTKNCLEVYDMLGKRQPMPPHSERFTKKPQSKLTKKESLKILNRNYYYLQGDKDTVHLSTKSGFWLERFSDGTYSKLKLNWVEGDAFDIAFLESTNLVRKLISRDGEKYHYTVVDKFDQGFIIGVEVFKDIRYQTFKIFAE